MAEGSLFHGAPWVLSHVCFLSCSGGDSGGGGWQDHYDLGLASERAEVDGVPVEQLLARVAAGRVGRYYTIWYSIAQRASPKEALPVLVDSLWALDDKLDQFHCAVAILHLLGDEPLVSGSYSQGTSASKYVSSAPDVEEARCELRCRVSNLIGDRDRR
jgi:hypothetical protein